jgi:uroporphyrinogen-III synthase
LTSGAATEIFIEKLRESNIGFNGKIYVLGKRSFDLLKTANLDAVYFSAANTAREMLKKIAPEDLKNKRFLFVRGEKSLRVVPDFLSGVAEIDEAIVYRTENVTIAVDKIKELVEMSKKHRITCAIFFSPSGAESFLEQCGAQILHQIKIATIGKTTADFLEKRDLKVDFTARKATAKDFAIELIDFLRNQSQIKQQNN